MLTKYLLFLAMGGAIQGFLLVLYCMFTRSGNPSARRLLAVIIFILCHITIINVLLTNGDLTALPHLSFTQSALAFLLAPLYYLLIESIHDKHFRFSSTMLFHFLPLIVFLAWSSSFYILPAEQKKLTIALMGIDRDHMVASPFNKNIYYVALITQMLGYLSIIVKKWIGRKLTLSSGELKFSFALIVFFSLTILLVTIRYLFYYSIASAILLPSFLALGLYALSFWTIWAEDPFLSFKHRKKKYSHSSLSSITMKQIANRIMDVLVNDQLFLEKNLSIDKLANELDVSTHAISQSLNIELNESYSNLINRLRVERVLNMLNSKDHTGLSIEGIAFESGFNSKSSFYRAFKKHTGLTPSAYLKKN